MTQVQTPVSYELEPIGVNGSLEAVAVHWYCSTACRDAAHPEGHNYGSSGDYEPGTQCEQCGEEV